MSLSRSCARQWLLCLTLVPSKTSLLSVRAHTHPSLLSLGGKDHHETTVKTHVSCFTDSLTLALAMRAGSLLRCRPRCALPGSRRAGVRSPPCSPSDHRLPPPERSASLALLSPAPSCLTPRLFQPLPIRRSGGVYERLQTTQNDAV